MRKFWISFLIILIFSNFSYATTYVSLAPSITEIIYALGAEDNLLGVSSACDYPKEAKTKEIVGNNYFANKEKIIKLNPDYVLGIRSTNGINSRYLGSNIKNIQFDFENLNDIYKTILEIGRITNKEDSAKNLVKNMNKNVLNVKKAKKNKKILYVIGINPIITVGNKSFISDFIELSGNTNIASDINAHYPQLSLEYLIKKEPDIIIVANFVKDNNIFKKYFKHSKIIFLTKEQEDIINRAGIRSYMAIDFFSKL